jgi:Domain of unknown function (DUF1707)
VTTDTPRPVLRGRYVVAGDCRPGHDGRVSTDPDRHPELRAGDGDRQRVAERLRQAHAEGRLDLDEFDQRVTAAYSARTYGDLDALTADLPPEPAPAIRAPAPIRGSSAAVAPQGPDRGAVSAWATASLVNVLIWGVVSVAAVGPVYPWWIWVAGPWGVLLLAQWIGAQRGPREP